MGYIKEKTFNLFMRMREMIDFKAIDSYALIAMFVLIAFFGGCNYLNKKFGLPNDNIIEQAVEDEIEKKFGVDIDLTPE